MTRPSKGDIALMLANAVVWGIPTAIFALLVFYQFQQGSFSLFLVVIGPLPYATGLIVSTLGAILLWRRGRFGAARAVGLVDCRLRPGAS